MNFQVNGETYFLSLAEDERRWLFFVETDRGTRPVPVYVDAPLQTGFGTQLIERSIRSFDGGEAGMLIESQGISWKFKVPLPPLPCTAVSQGVAPGPPLQPHQLFVAVTVPASAPDLKIQKSQSKSWHLK